ncbi:MAG: alpha/beta hydrolase [Anaerolineales bacterium]|nr:alpha/beta hydrolase [Anaerolineales bacterium]
MTENQKPKRLKRTLLWILAIIVLLLLVGPFLVPVPALENTVPRHALADPDSLFIELNGLEVHYKRAGSGEPTFILLHGFGANLVTWREVMEPLAQSGTVIAFDRPAFGLTERPLTWEGLNPYSPEAQIELLLAMIETFEIQIPILVGNSAGGTVATSAVLAHPQRFAGLVLVDAAIYAGGGAPDFIKPILRTPQIQHLGPLVSRWFGNQGERLLELAWYDQSKIPADLFAEYGRASQVENWDRALWEFTLASHSLAIPERVSEIEIPVLVISGEQDQIVPLEQSLRLAEEIPGASLVVIPQCGHVPQEECPQDFMTAIDDFLEKHDLK